MQPPRRNAVPARITTVDPGGNDTATRHPRLPFLARALRRRLRHFLGHRAVDGARCLVFAATWFVAVAGHGGRSHGLYGAVVAASAGAPLAARWRRQRPPRRDAMDRRRAGP